MTAAGTEGIVPRSAAIVVELLRVATADPEARGLDLAARGPAEAHGLAAPDLAGRAGVIGAKVAPEGGLGAGMIVVAPWRNVASPRRRCR